MMLEASGRALVATWELRSEHLMLGLGFTGLAAEQVRRCTQAVTWVQALQLLGQGIERWSLEAMFRHGAWLAGLPIDGTEQLSYVAMNAGMDTVAAVILGVVGKEAFHYKGVAEAVRICFDLRLFHYRF